MVFHEGLGNCSESMAVRVDRSAGCDDNKPAQCSRDEITYTDCPVRSSLLLMRRCKNPRSLGDKQAVPCLRQTY